MRGYSHWGIIRRRLWVGNRVNRHPPDPTARDLYAKMLRLICLNATFRPYAWALIMLKCVDTAREIENEKIVKMKNEFFLFVSITTKF